MKIHQRQEKYWKEDKLTEVFLIKHGRWKLCENPKEERVQDYEEIRMTRTT